MLQDELGSVVGQSTGARAQWGRPYAQALEARAQDEVDQERIRAGLKTDGPVDAILDVEVLSELGRGRREERCRHVNGTCAWVRVGFGRR